MDTERPRWQRESRCDRVSQTHERDYLSRAAGHYDRCRGIDGLAGGLAPDLSRWARFRVQVEHGVDERHASLHEPRANPPALAPQSPDLWTPLCLLRKLHPAAEP